MTGAAARGPSPPPPRGLRQAVGGLFDQGIYSITNFALAVVVASSVSRASFGAFALVFVLYLFALNVSETLTCEVFAVLYGASKREAAAGALRASAGCALAFGAVMGVLTGATALFAGGALGEALPAFAVIAPAVFLQDFWRYAFFALGRPRAAIANDVVWAFVQGALLATVSLTGATSVSWFVLAWGGGAVAGAILGVFQAGVLPRPQAGWKWLRTHAHLGVRFAVELVSFSGGSLVVVAVLGAHAGLAEVASLRAAQLVYGPIQGLISGLRLAVTPVAVRALGDGTRALRKVIRWVTVGLAGGTAAWAGASLLIPDSLGTTLFGDSWTGARSILPAVALLYVLVAATFGPTIGLRALRAARTSLRARFAIAIVMTTLGCAGAFLDGAAGAAEGMAAALAAGFVLLEWSFQRVLVDPPVPRQADEFAEEILSPGLQP